MKRFISYFLALCLCTALCAQSWDAALDQYEQISDECILLRQRSQGGEKVSASSLMPLLGRLASLRKNLQNSGGKMSPAQKQRFESIRNRYDRAFGEPRTVTGVFLKSPDPLLGKMVLPPVPETDRPGPAPVYAPVPGYLPLRYSTVVFAGIPDWSLGVMAAVSKGRWGGFLKGAFPLQSQSAGYDCFSDGTTATGYIWTSGKEKVSRFSITAGATYAAWPFLALYAGAGYGSRSILWEDASARWANVRDKHARGLAVDAGVLLSYGHFLLMAGVSATGFRPVTAEVGAGCFF